MARDKDWIGANCSSGESFAPLARRAMASHIGEVFYVDLSSTGKGADAGDGDNWDRPYLTINHALDQVTAYDNDYILVKGWKTETGTGIIATLDVAGCHVIGQPILMNPYFQEKGSLYRSGEANTPHTSITAEFVEFAGFSIMAHQGSTAANSPSVQKGMVALGTYAAAGGNKAYLHNLHFCDWNHAESTCGLRINGSHYDVVEDVVVDSIYGNIDEGIYISGSSVSNSANIVIKNLWGKGGQGGALATPIKLYGGTSLQSSYIDGVRGARSTYLVDFTSDYSSAYCIFDNFAGNMTAGNIFNSASTIDARDTLLSVMGGIAGSNMYGATIFPDT